MLLYQPFLKTLQALAQKKDKQIYLVGGFLRDFLVSVPKMDFDFAIDAGALKFAKDFSRKVKGAYVVLDKERGCARVVKRISSALATFDFADFRDTTLKGDLQKRDFTINTLCLNVLKLKFDNNLKDQILDKKMAARDFSLKKIRMVSARAFKDDPLRMMRAFTLQANLGFAIDQKTLGQIRKDVALIRSVSSERIRDELFKILETGEAYQNLKIMDKIGLLKEIIPQIHVMYRCEQGGYHHLDVFRHSLEAVKQLEKLLREVKSDSDISPYLQEPLAAARSREALLKLGTLLHDIGKPQTKKIDGKRVSFYGHEHVGKNMVRTIARMLKLSTRERYSLEDMVQWHLRPGYLGDFKKPSERAIYRYFRDAKDEAVSILLLSIADQRATRGPLTIKKDAEHHEKICQELIKKYFELKKQKPFVRLINGNDLIRILKLKPSPLFKEILDRVEESQNLGKITAKEEALQLARGIVNKKGNKEIEK